MELLRCTSHSIDQGIAPLTSLTSGVYFFMGGVLMIIGGVLEFVLGNTFSLVVFCSFGESLTLSHG